MASARWLNQQIYFLTVLEAGKFKIKVSGIRFLGELSLSLADRHLFLCPPTAERAQVLVSLSVYDTNPIMEASPSRPSLYLEDFKV